MFDKLSFTSTGALFLLALLICGFLSPAAAEATPDQEIYRRALNHYRSSAFDKAEPLLKEVQKRTRSDTLARNSYYLLGRIYKQQEKKPVVALKYFYRVLSRFPPSNLTDDSLYFIAEIYVNQLNQPESALQYLQVVQDHFPDGDYYNRAVKELNRLKQQLGKEPPSHSLNDIPRPRIKLNFEKIDVKQLISTYADLSGRNFVYKPSIEGAVTVIGKEGIPVDNLFDVFVSLLETRGFTVTREEDLYRVEATQQAFQRGISTKNQPTGLRTQLFDLGQLPEKEVKAILQTVLPQRNQIVILPELNQVLVSSSPSRLEEIGRLLTGLRAMGVPQENKKIFKFVPRYTQAKNLKQKLENFLPDFMDKRKFKVMADPRSNVLIVAADKASVDFIRRLAQRFDQDIVDRLHMKVFRLQYADEEKVAKQIKQLLQILPKEYTSQNIKVVPDDRQKAIIVSAVSQQVFKIVGRVIKDLDQKSRGTPQNIRVFRLQHADEEEVATTLNEMMGVLPGEFPAGKIKILPDRRQKAIIVSAESRKVFEVVERMVKELDRESARTPQRYHVYKVRNSRAGPLAEKLNFLYENQQDAIRMTADEQTNSLVISAPEDVYDEIQPIIERLDSPKKQILIDAYIVEASTDKVKELGIEWGAEGQVTDRDFTVGTQFGGGPSLPPGSVPDQGLVAGILNDQGNAFLSAIHALDQDEDFEILSTAHLMANENEEATLSVGEVIPILTQSQTTPEGTLNQSFDFQNVGIDLNIVPKLSSENAVSLDVHQRIQEVEQASPEGVVGAPTRRNRDIQTNVAVPEGVTLVLGGVLQKTTSRTFQTVPIVGKIPGIKYLFQNWTESNVRTNLLVFLQPTVLDTREDLQSATRRLKEEQELGGPGVPADTETVSDTNPNAHEANDLPEFRKPWKDQ